MTRGNESNLLETRQGLGEKKNKTKEGFNSFVSVKMRHLFDVFVFSAPLVDSNSIHSGSAMLMLVTVVFVGLAAFFIYKFKRFVHFDGVLIHP